MASRARGSFGPVPLPVGMIQSATGAMSVAGQEPPSGRRRAIVSMPARKGPEDSGYVDSGLLRARSLPELRCPLTQDRDVLLQRKRRHEHRHKRCKAMPKLIGEPQETREHERNRHNDDGSQQNFPGH
jgi:hypothetical protein